ncbi:MAG: hypothetical protein FWD16_07980 [Clostridia bacterium]|nr:hypothetical protein [Clostridia bacterium]
MPCPRCNSPHAHSLNQYQTYTQTKGYGCCKGLLGYLLFGWWGWLCGLCGMGKTKSRTTQNTLWVCDSCGHRYK